MLFLGCGSLHKVLSNVQLYIARGPERGVGLAHSSPNKLQIVNVLQICAIESFGGSNTSNVHASVVFLLGICMVRACLRVTGYAYGIVF